MQIDKLSIFDKKKLATAYMHLYEALVLQYQSKNGTCGESLYHALRKIDEIMSKHRGKSGKLVMDYLDSFHSANRKVQSKKAMTADNRYDRVDVGDKSSVASGVKMALAEFEQAIYSVDNPNVLVVIPKTPLRLQCSKGFYDWAVTLPEETLESLEKDPKEFERQYRHFVLSRRFKSK